MIQINRNGQGDLYVPAGHDNTVSSRKMYYPGNGCDKVDTHITTFVPGAGMAEETHPFSDHIMYLLKGKLELRQGGKTIAILVEGDAVRIPAGDAHQVRNPGSEDGTFFVITVPPIK